LVPKKRAVDTRKFRERLEQGDTYGLLLILLIATYIEVAIVGRSDWGQVVLAISFAGVLLLSLHTSHVRGKWMRVMIVVAILVVAFNVTQALIGNEAYTGSSYLWIAFIVASPVVILNRIFRHPAVDIETILGAICAYLMIGIAFAAIYGMMNQLGSEPFFAQSGSHPRIDYLYFSFVVLTTTGFGDLTPAGSIGKVLVTLEALLGQVFLVTIIATLVASFGGVRFRQPGEAPEDPDEGSTRA
jgi:hypothetical protein